MPAPNRSHSAIREGLVAGSLAAAAVAAWFFVVDVVAAQVFFTPVRLGQAVGRVFGIAPMADSKTVAFISYTIIHFAAFIAVASLAAALVHFARRQPSVLAGVFLLFIVSEALIYGFIALLHATEVLQHLTWPLIAVGNLIGALVIGWKLWRDHPGLGRDLDSALGGRA
jgi:hypothetical protein